MDIVNSEIERMLMNDLVIKLSLITDDKKLIKLYLNQVDNIITVNVFDCHEVKRLRLFFDVQRMQKPISEIIELLKQTKLCKNIYCDNDLLLDNCKLIDDLCVFCHLESQSTDTLDSECSICLEPNNIYSITTSCDHTYHKKCLDKCKNKHYKRNNIKCPICRTKLSFNKQMKELCFHYTDSEYEDE